MLATAIDWPATITAIGTLVTAIGGLVLILRTHEIKAKTGVVEKKIDAVHALTNGTLTKALEAELAAKVLAHDTTDQLFALRTAAAAPPTAEERALQELAVADIAELRARIQARQAADATATAIASAVSPGG